MDRKEKIICLSCLSALIAANMGTKIYYDKKKENIDKEDNEIKSNLDEYLHKVAGRDKLIIGYSKNGKTPLGLYKMLMANKGSVVFDDYNGEMYDMTAEELHNKGYHIKRFDLSKENEVHFNPLSYLKDEIDVDNFVNAVFEAKEIPEDYIYEDEKNLLNACIDLVLFENETKEQKNLPYVLDLLKSDDLENIFNEINDESESYKRYENFRKKDTCEKNIIVKNLNKLLSIYSIPHIAEMLKDDGLDIDSFTNNKIALYIYDDDTMEMYGSIISLLYNTLFTTVLEKTDNEIPVHIYATSLCKIPHLNDFLDIKNVMTMSHDKNNISITLHFEDTDTFKKMYGKDTNDIINKLDLLTPLN